MRRVVGLTKQRNRYVWQLSIPKPARYAFQGRQLVFRYLGDIPRSQAEAHAIQLRAHYVALFNRAIKADAATRAEIIAAHGIENSDRLSNAVLRMLEAIPDAPPYDDNADDDTQARQLLDTHKLVQARQAARKRAGASASGTDLSALVDRWIERTRPRSRGTITQARRWCREFQQVTGCNDVRRITQADVLAFARNLEQQASRGAFSNGTAQAGLRRIAKLFGTAQALGIVQVNVAAGITIATPNTAPFADNAPRGYTDADVQLILSRVHELRRPTDRLLLRWMLYSGARAGDLTNIRPGDVREVSSIVVADIHDRHAGGSLKNKGAVRLLPVHSAVLPDVLAHAGACGSDPLFPGSTAQRAANRFQQLANAWLRSIGLDTAHAARHSAVARMRAVGIAEQTIAAVVGHGPKNVTAHYGRALPVATLRDAIEMIRY